MVGKGGGMRRHRAGSDLLGTMERCLASVRERADAAGISVELAIPVNPALLQADTTALGQLGHYLLSYAIGSAITGDRLMVRLDVTQDETITLEVAEECAGPDHRAQKNCTGPAEGDAASMARARSILDAAGGRLSVSSAEDGRMHLFAMLPTRSGEARRPPAR